MLLSGDAGKLTKQQREFLQQVYGGGQRMTDLVNSLLNVSRVELGAFAVDPEPLSLKKIVQDAVSDLKPMIKEKKIKLKETYEPRMKKYSGDRRLLGIIFQNLLSNAVKYTPEKGTIELTLETHPKKKNILLTLSDTGYGIPKAEQKKIFSKLYRADNVKEIDSSGTGLGLYIVKAIMDTVGGKIWFESEEGKGTIFFVELPLSGMKAKEGSRPLE